jgi:5-methylcytosine-specific restriction protein A
MVQATPRMLIDYDVDAHKPKQDSNGNYLCLNCGRSLTFDGRRVKYCCTSCEIQYAKAHPVILWVEFRLKVFERDGWICKKCGKPVSESPYWNKGTEKAECDHIIPLFKGGKEFDMENLQTLCSRCHNKKSAKEARERTKLGKLVSNGIQKTL